MLESPTCPNCGSKSIDSSLRCNHCSCQLKWGDTEKTTYRIAGLSGACPKCRFENASQNKFCVKCGTSLVFSCSVCGEDHDLGTIYCPQKGLNIEDWARERLHLQREAERRKSLQAEQAQREARQVLEAERARVDSERLSEERKERAKKAGLARENKEIKVAAACGAVIFLGIVGWLSIPNGAKPQYTGPRTIKTRTNVRNVRGNYQVFQANSLLRCGELAITQTGDNLSLSGQLGGRWTGEGKLHPDGGSYIWRYSDVSENGRKSSGDSKFKVANEDGSLLIHSRDNGGHENDYVARLQPK